MRCPKCGAKNEHDAVFCENCGGKLGKKKHEATKIKQKVIKKIKEIKKPAKAKKIKLKGYKPGGFLIRLLARFLDSFILLIPNVIIIAILSLIIGVGVGGIYDSNVVGGILAFVSIFIIFVLNMIYFVIMDGLGGTLGKKICGLMVINQQGKNIGIGKAVLRHFVYSLLNIIPWIGSFVYLLGYLAIAWDANKQGWHDKFAKSFVVYKEK